MNYNSALKTWGATGTEYPDAYSYKKDESPVDEWDNYFASNVIQDLEHLIGATNDDLLLRNGGSLLSDLSVGDYGLVGTAGSVDFGGTEITVDGTVDLLQSLDVGGSITVTGTVDGVDLGLLKTDYDTHAADASFHHTRYADSEAISAINAETSLTVDISGDAETLDNLNSTDFARLYDGVQAPVYATLGDVPASIGKGELVFVDGEGKLYVEDGS